MTCETFSKILPLANIIIGFYCCLHSSAWTVLGSCCNQSGVCVSASTSRCRCANSTDTAFWLHFPNLDSLKRSVDTRLITQRSSTHDAARLQASPSGRWCAISPDSVAIGSSQPPLAATAASIAVAASGRLKCHHRRPLIVITSAITSAAAIVYQCAQRRLRRNC